LHQPELQQVLPRVLVPELEQLSVLPVQVLPPLVQAELRVLHLRHLLLLLLQPHSYYR
jgi:hypothetical protein